jgi:hypothetical protein
MARKKKIAVTKRFQSQLARFEGVPVNIQTARNKAVLVKELYQRANHIKEHLGLSGTPHQIASYFVLMTDGYRTGIKSQPWSVEGRMRCLKDIFSQYGLQILERHEKMISMIECAVNITPPPSAVRKGFNWEKFSGYWMQKQKEKESRLAEYRRKYGMISRNKTKPNNQ